MNAITARKIIDACHEAGQIVALLPALPKGMTPLYVRVLDVIYTLDSLEGHVCVSDISRAMGLSFPGVTRAVKALEALGAVKKAADPKDRRFVNIELTKLGQEWYRTYVGDYYENLANALSDLSDEETETMFRVIGRVREVMLRAAEADEEARTATGEIDEKRSARNRRLIGPDPDQMGPEAVRRRKM